MHPSLIWCFNLILDRRVGRIAFLVYLQLLNNSEETKSGGRVVEVNKRRLAETVRIHPRTVLRAVTELRESGLVTTEPVRANIGDAIIGTRYTILEEPPHWTDRPPPPAPSRPAPSRRRRSPY